MPHQQSFFIWFIGLSLCLLLSLTICCTISLIIFILTVGINPYLWFTCFGKWILCYFYFLGDIAYFFLVHECKPLLLFCMKWHCTKYKSCIESIRWRECHLWAIMKTWHGHNSISRSICSCSNRWIFVG